MKTIGAVTAGGLSRTLPGDSSTKPSADTGRHLAATKAAAILLGCYRQGEASDPEIYVRAVTAVLGRYDVEIIKAVCDPASGLPSTLKWLPAIAEVKAACEAHAVRAAMRERLGPPLPAVRHAMIEKGYTPRKDISEATADLAVSLTKLKEATRHA